MSTENLEQAFLLMDEAVMCLRTALDVSYYDAYIENGENILDHYQINVSDNVPDAQTVQKLKSIYQQLAVYDLQPTDIRKLTQWLLLKGNKEEPLQANHQLTPDSLGFLFVYLIEQLYKKTRTLSVLDIATGMSNLLLTVLVQLDQAGYKTKGTGIDIDDMLLSISAVSASLVGNELALYHQDGLQDSLLEPVDVALSDLPVGYYPNDERAKHFVTAAEKGHSYAHHLLMEQAMKYVKADGYGLFLVPSNFLASEQSASLKQWFTKHVRLQAIIQLPDDLFSSENSQKSIVILRNQDAQSSTAQEVFVAKLSSLKAQQGLTHFMKQFEDWNASNL